MLSMSTIVKARSVIHTAILHSCKLESDTEYKVKIETKQQKSIYFGIKASFLFCS